MIHGYKELDGKFLPLTRVSNSTFIDYPHKFEIENNVYVGHHNFIEASNGIKIERRLPNNKFCHHYITFKS